MESGKDFDEELNMVKFTSIAWTHDGKGFFYQVLMLVCVYMYVLCVYVMCVYVRTIVHTFV